MTLADWIEDELIGVFVRAADLVAGNEFDLDGMTADELAAVPMTLFAAQERVVSAWREHVGVKEMA